MSQLDRYLEPPDPFECPHEEEHDMVADCDAYEEQIEEDARIEEADARRKGDDW